jgi:hypothetical protein
MRARSTRAVRFRLDAVRLAGMGLVLAMAAWTGGAARAEDPAFAFLTTSPRLFKVCTDQTYALCAVASCFVFNGLSYCKCDVKSGASISLPFDYGRRRDVCTVNAEGENNGYMVSTFSLAESVVAPYGNKALYDCPAGTSNGAYAQCDGGVCFTGSEGQSFPGFDKSLKKHEIICSCPITVASPTAMTGYQIAGPYPCQQSFFRNCKKAVTNTDTGSEIYVGAPTGSARALTRELYGFVPPLDECRLASPGPPVPPWGAEPFR